MHEIVSTAPASFLELYFTPIIATDYKSSHYSTLSTHNVLFLLLKVTHFKMTSRYTAEELGSLHHAENRFRWQSIDEWTKARTWVIMYPTDLQAELRTTWLSMQDSGGLEANEDEEDLAVLAQQNLNDLYEELLKTAKVAVDQAIESTDMTAKDD